MDEHDDRRPRVSVIVPSYRSALVIERCVTALATQSTAHPFEIIVVDSGDDGAAKVAQRVLPTVRTVIVPKRVVAPRARNLGVLAARAETLAFVDSDAYADSDWIDNVVAASETGYDLISGSIGNVHRDSAVARAEQLLMFNEFLPDAPSRPSWFGLSGNMVMNRSAFEHYGPFVEVRAAEDVVFSRRLIAAGGRVLFYPKLRVFHDNRTRLGPYLRNQVLVGRHTALARRLVAFADTSSYWLFLILLPVSPMAKLMKMFARASRRREHLLAMLREFPLLFAGICAYCLGMVLGAGQLHVTGPPPPQPAESNRVGQGIGSTDRSVGGAGAEAPGKPTSKAPMSGAEPDQGR